jgi:hypothetical protein
MLQRIFQLSKRIGNSTIVWSVRKVKASPALKMRVVAVLARYPQLKHRMSLRALRASGELLSRMSDGTPLNLSPRAARIYADLKRAIEARAKTDAYRH